VEAFTQRAAVEFYQSKANEDCYIQVFRFYELCTIFLWGCKPTRAHPDEDWLLKAPLDKPGPTLFASMDGMKNICITPIT